MGEPSEDKYRGKKGVSRVDAQDDERFSDRREKRASIVITGPREKRHDTLVATVFHEKGSSLLKTKNTLQSMVAPCHQSPPVQLRYYKRCRVRPKSCMVHHLFGLFFVQKELGCFVASAASSCLTCLGYARVSRQHGNKKKRGCRGGSKIG